MLRLPYKWRKKEGIGNKIPGTGALWYYTNCFLENLYIKSVPLPACGVYSGSDRSEKIIVSLTSFPARIDETFFAIKSLMIQSMKADRILLWLSDEQFPDRKLPDGFSKLIDAGLEICWCADLKSHKKYFYALQQQKENELVITYDDDIIYEFDSIEKLIKKHIQYPGAIICNRGLEIKFDASGNMLPYSAWSVASSIGFDGPAKWVLPSTGAGCLYPYGIMPPITFNWEVASQNALTADDLWMRFCSLSNNVQAVKTLPQVATLCNVKGSQRERLNKQNNDLGENDRVIKRLQKIFAIKYDN